MKGSCNATFKHVGVKTMILYEGGQKKDEKDVECSNLENEGGLLPLMKILHLF